MDKEHSAPEQRKVSYRRWAARLLIGLVLAWNVQCAILFLWSPQAFAPGFELSGATGEGMLRGIGILFLMWNVPYAVALLNPSRYRVSLYEAIAMQSIGLLGESALLLTLPAGHMALHSSVLRFITYDGIGLAALILAAWITRSKEN
ncbi:MAG: hypothetical protein JXB15_08730 [Anaerolineales bacterium]|nr:hypothetical protein [Anaerolineales bacterium]